MCFLTKVRARSARKIFGLKNTRLKKNTRKLRLDFFTQTDPTRTVQRSALCRSRRELSNAYLLAKIGVDTAENEPLEVWGKNLIQYSLHSLVTTFGQSYFREGAQAMDTTGGNRDMCSRFHVFPPLTFCKHPWEKIWFCCCWIKLHWPTKPEVVRSDPATSIILSSTNMR